MKAQVMEVTDIGVIVRIKCNICKEPIQFELPDQGIKEYSKGTLVQRAFPDLPADKREMLVSGTCGECFNKMFPEEEE